MSAVNLCKCLLSLLYLKVWWDGTEIEWGNTGDRSVAWSHGAPARFIKTWANCVGQAVRLQFRSWKWEMLIISVEGVRTVDDVCASDLWCLCCWCFVFLIYDLFCWTSISLVRRFTDSDWKQSLFLYVYTCCGQESWFWLNPQRSSTHILNVATQKSNI